MLQFRGPLTNNYFFNVFPYEVRACLVAYCDFNAALNSLMQQELSCAWHVLAMVHPDRNILATGLQLANLEPNQQVVFGAHMRCAYILPVLNGL